ncbi:pilus_B_mal_scr, type IVB pilus formation outer membrane protein, R64 PilN family [Burkholderiaceae bacterium]
MSDLFEKNRQRVEFSLVLVSLSILSGCTLTHRLAQQEERVKQTTDLIDHKHRTFEIATRTPKDKARAQSIDKPWLMGRAVPLAREVSLPSALRTKIDTTLMYRDGRVDLPTLAERITQATSIPVRIKPEALLPVDHFLPRLNASAGQTASSGMTQVQLPMGARPLPEVLDILSRRLGVLWRYHDRALEFYRTETRVFDVRSLTLSAHADARLGRAANSKSGGFDNSSRTSLVASEQHVLLAIQQRLEPFLTRSAIIAAQPGASTSIVITDTPEVLGEIARYIERENRILTRRVRLIFEEITLVTNQDAEFGLDWDSLWEQGKVAASLSSSFAGASVAGAAALVSARPSSVVRSQAVLKALSKYGTVLRHVTIPVLTLNRRPVTHAVRTTFSYIDQVKSTQPADNGPSVTRAGLGSVSVSQKEETVGAFLTLVPDAQENGQILLSVAYDNTVAQPLKSLVVGEPNSRLQIQQITIDGHGTVQQVALKAGQPMLISGFDSKHDDSERSRLAPEVPLMFGGMDRAKQGRTATLIIVTAQVEEGI